MSEKQRSAVRTLYALGYTHQGGDKWVPPQAPPARKRCEHNWHNHRIGGTTYLYVYKCARCGSIWDRA